MSEMPGNPRCPVLAVKTYLSKRNKQCQALWQKPKNHKAMKFSPAEDVWYCNSPLGKHKLENLLSEMSKKAGLATIYTSHCSRATSVTILKASGLENARVKSVTGHKSDSAVESYHKRPTLEQQVESSAIVSDFVAGPTRQRKSSDGNPAKPPRGGIRISSAGRFDFFTGRQRVARQPCGAFC